MPKGEEGDEGFWDWLLGLFIIRNTEYMQFEKLGLRFVNCGILFYYFFSIFFSFLSLEKMGLFCFLKSLVNSADPF